MKRLARIEAALSADGITGDEVRFLLGYWKEHLCFPEGTRPYAVEFMTRWVETIAAMHASVPSHPPGVETKDYWEQRRDDRLARKMATEAPADEPGRWSSG